MQCSFIHIPKVAAWMRGLCKLAARRKFLVLNGASRLGKTAHAMSLYGADRSAEVNCAGVSHPPLRSFNPGAHSLVLFDQTSTIMVLASRRLFQAPNANVIIGTSPTNMNAYSVYLNNAALVIATNTWRQELPALPSAEREWLEANMVYIEVDKPLFGETSQAAPRIAQQVHDCVPEKEVPAGEGGDAGSAGRDDFGALVQREITSTLSRGTSSL